MSRWRCSAAQSEHIRNPAPGAASERQDWAPRSEAFCVFCLFFSTGLSLSLFFSLSVAEVVVNTFGMTQVEMCDCVCSVLLLFLCVSECVSLFVKERCYGTCCWLGPKLSSVFCCFHSVTASSALSSSNQKIPELEFTSNWFNFHFIHKFFPCLFGSVEVRHKSLTKTNNILKFDKESWINCKILKKLWDLEKDSRSSLIRKGHDESGFSVYEQPGKGVVTTVDKHPPGLPPGVI